jgi:AraC-like DNA-binding protein
MRQVANRNSTTHLAIWRSPSAPGIVFHRGEGISHSYPRHWHDELHICAYTGGAGNLASRGHTHRIRTGDLVIMPPGQVHENWVDGASDITFHSLYIDTKVLSKGLPDSNELTATIADCPNLMPGGPILHKKLVQLSRVTESPASSLECDEALLDFLDLLTIEAGRRPRTYRSIHEHRAIRRVREYLHAHFADSIGLTQLGFVAGLSPFHVQRLFRLQTGMSPHAYQTQLRINHAMVLLRRSHSLCEIAIATGFADQSHLTRNFLRLVGITPGRYSRLLNPRQSQKFSRPVPIWPQRIAEAPALGG